MGVDNSVGRRNLLKYAGIAGAAGMVATAAAMFPRPVSPQQREFKVDWIMLNHGRHTTGSAMSELKRGIIEVCPNLVDPDHILTPNYPNPDNPNLERWMKQRMEVLASAQKFGNRGWMWDYSASAPVGFSALGEYGHQLPEDVRKNLRVRIIGGGIVGRVPGLYRLVNEPGFEAQVIPHIGKGIDHLHAREDSTVTEGSAMALAEKFGYLGHLRFVRGTDHGGIVSRRELLTVDMFQAKDSN